MTKITHRDPSLRNHYVYRLFDASGRLLYVGCTIKPRLRFGEHRSERAVMYSRVNHIRMVGPLPYATARAIEREALLTESPIYGRSSGRGYDTDRAYYERRRCLQMEMAGRPRQTAIALIRAESDDIFGAVA